ncbi:DUF1853 family protein [Psychroflexus sediminis]|uniref:DUF1853 domain-containing protein n=1 Tax=Psychroflexus sediminis TaxID=470826 RepID=A0A1G7YLK1_9FLAO|nr:DUF1853 family protein [Psychroflexus sediminis]SDG97274.1 hypothetical protein SAMN04488027_11320 [Psychroflexus sediminis]
METKDSDLQVLNQYQGFMNAKLMIDQLPDSTIPAFEFERLEDIRQIDNFPYDEARVFNFLGKRAEVFFRYYLNLSNRYDEIAYSLQILNDKITIGEFDFLCQDVVQNEILHVELVNKIYLYDDSLHENPDYCWIGPNKRDRLIDKLDKLKSQQFPLLYHPKAESSLHKFNIDPWKVKQRICFKSILFLPEHCNIRFYATNLEAVAGYFYTLSQFLSKKWKHQSFFIPKKINWFTDETRHTNWYSYSKVLLKLQEFMENKQSVMLFRRNKKGETHKFFVVWW